MKDKSAKKQADQQFKNDMAAMELQRQWDIEDRDEARAYSRQVYSMLVEDAEAAGFNPLTALRNGGGANYNAAAGMAPLSRKAPVKQAVGGSAVGDALTGLGDFISNFDPFADQKREQEYRLIESQISALNAGALSGAPRGAASFAQGDVERRPSGRAAALSVPGPLGKPTPFQANDVNVTNPWGSLGGEVAPWAADGSSFEDRYGEVGGAIIGMGVMGADAIHNGGRGLKHLRGVVEAKAKEPPKVRKSGWPWLQEKVLKSRRAPQASGGGGW